MSELIANLDKIHTTELGEKRIIKNLALNNIDVVEWCKNAVKNSDLAMHIGKNWYVYYNGNAITVNANSYTIITADKIRGKVRKIKESDYACFAELLYQAIFVKKGESVPTREIINKPEMNIYIKDFGAQYGDIGVVAEQNGQVIGGAWTRIIPAYGHIDNKTPELAISLLPEFRGCGIGGKLMKKLFSLLKEQGFTQTSLSVQKENRAFGFYKKLGYKIIGESDDREDVLMIKHL